MAKGVKPKGKGKQTGDEHKPTKTTSNDASKKADKNKYAVERDEDPEPLFENHNNGPVSPALITRAMHGEQYTTWQPPSDDRDAGGGGAGNGWGGTARSWVPDNDWDPPPTHSTHDVPPVPAKSPAPYPLNNAPLGTIPENRYSSSTRSAGAHEHQDEYGQGHEYHEYQNQGQDRNDHDWNNIPNPAHQTTQTATTTAVPSMRGPSPTHRDMDIPLSALNTSVALAEHNKKPLKYSSASAAAKKVESNTAPANRNSFWSQTHQIAAAKNGIFLPQPEGKGGGKGPHVFDTPPVGAMRAAPVDEMNTIPAWMQWGDPHRNKPPSQAQHGHPAGHPQQRHPAHPQSRAAPAHRKASPSWQKWGKMASAHERHIPPSDSSEDEEEWEEVHGDWSGAGQGWGHPAHSQRGGNPQQAWDHRGAHPGRPTSGAHGWGQAGDARGRPKSGGPGWGHAGGGGGGGGGAWGDVGGGKGAGAPNAWDPMGTAGGGGGAWGGAPAPAGAAWGGGGGGGTWENASTLNSGYDDGSGWGNPGGGNAPHGWEAAPGTSKVNPSASAEDAMVGGRNALSPRERTQILNNLLNGATAEQKSKTKSKQQHDAGDGWGMPAGVPVDDGWEGGGKGNEKEKKKKKKYSKGGWGMWGGGGAAQDDGWGAPAGGKGKIKKKKKQEEDHGGWGAPAEDPHAKKKKRGNHQDDWGWGGEGEGHAEDDWGIPKGGAKNQDQGSRGGGRGAWGNDHDDDGDDEYDDGWGGGKGERSWAAWETAAEQEGGKKSKAKKVKGDDPYAAWGTGGQGGWGDDDKENDHRVRFAGRESAAWGSQAGTAHGIPSKTMLHASMGIANSAHNASAPQLLGGPKLLESNGAAFKGVHSAFYSLNRPARERFHWMFPPQNDPRVMAILTWLQHAAEVVGTVGLQKFLQSRERGALFVNATFRLPDDPDQPVFDWLTFDKLQPTMDKTLQESTAFYDPAFLVIVFVYLSSPSGNSVAIWRRKIRVPPVAGTMLQKEIGLIKMGLRPENEYVVFLEEIPPKRAHKGRPASKTPHIPTVQAGPAARTTVVIKQAHQPSTTATIVKQAANAQVPVRTANVSAKGKIEVKKVETKKKRKWWQFFK